MRAEIVLETLAEDMGANRTLLRWLKLWDKVVFNSERKIKHKGKQEGKKENFQKFGSVLNDELDEHGCPQQKVALLCGPPGLGKTTLAHMVGTHAGYNVVEMNASDDRSPDAFRTQLEAATQMRSVMGTEPRPNCLVLDEIDGAPSASIDVLIKFVLGRDTGKVAHGKKKRRGGGVLKRPVVCICNDVYVPALRSLRQIALIVQFPPTASSRSKAHPKYHPLSVIALVQAHFLEFNCSDQDSGIQRNFGNSRDICRHLGIWLHLNSVDVLALYLLHRLAQRLLEIARKQHMKTDMRALVALAEKSHNDIRSCLSVLHFFKSQKKDVRLVDIQKSSIGLKDVQKGLFTVWREVFQIQRPKRKTYSTASVARNGILEPMPDLNSPEMKFGDMSLASRMHSVLQTVQSCSDYDRLVQGVYENFLNMSFRDNHLNAYKNCEHIVSPIVEKGTSDSNNSIELLALQVLAGVARTGMVLRRRRAEPQDPHDAELRSDAVSAIWICGVALPLRLSLLAEDRVPQRRLRVKCCAVANGSCSKCRDRGRAWPPQTPDNNPRHFLLWGYVKDKPDWPMVSYVEDDAQFTSFARKCRNENASRDASDSVQVVAPDWCFGMEVELLVQSNAVSFVEGQMSVREQRARQVLKELMRGMAPLVRMHSGAAQLRFDTLPLLLQILVPALRPVSLQLYNAHEKKDLNHVISVMIDYSLNYVQERTQDGSYVYNLDPNIEELTLFPGQKPARFLGYGSKQMISREVELEKMRRTEARTQSDGGAIETASSGRTVLPNHLQTLKPKTVAGEVVSLQLYNAHEKKDLNHVISVMIDYSLNYVQERTQDGSYVYNLDPNIEELTLFPGQKPARFLGYGSKQMISREVELEKMRRTEARTQTDGGAIKTASSGTTVLPNHLQTLKPKTVAGEVVSAIKSETFYRLDLVSSEEIFDLFVQVPGQRRCPN
ncbi:Chromosome transmission fidelity protein 18-like protein [Zootermopsis nevadensis]|uniref:Chromosome transmission fidelity protein 18-like protein n=1 Tax=Zootermopsis nevadensis TaxID=136037 RepID=A0A067QH82_ZOONE|nr:Chromosome transmission fidelity protein 18-like protein [Zootermopsis nevadensis]